MTDGYHIISSSYYGYFILYHIIMYHIMGSFPLVIFGNMMMDIPSGYEKHSHLVMGNPQDKIAPRGCGTCHDDFPFGNPFRRLQKLKIEGELRSQGIAENKEPKFQHLDVYFHYY